MLTIFEILKINNHKQKLTFLNERFYAYDTILIDTLNKKQYSNLLPIDNNNLLSKQLNLEYIDKNPLRIYYNGMVIYEEYTETSSANPTFTLYEYNDKNHIKQMIYGYGRVERFMYAKTEDTYVVLIYEPMLDTKILTSEPKQIDLKNVHEIFTEDYHKFKTNKQNNATYINDFTFDNWDD